jgi:23S rRNA (guanosine2251-2'-O)-methyltransferase
VSDEQQAVLEGIISIQAALKAGSRPIHEIYVQQGKLADNRAMRRLQHMAQKSGIPVRNVGSTVIERLASGHTHGGLVATVGPRGYVTLDDLLTHTSLPFLVMLDGIEDPFNFGTAVRAIYAAGAHGLVVRPRNWMSAASVVARSSAGTTELMPTAVAETAIAAAKYLRSRGLVVACATKGDAIPIYEADLTVPLFLVIGGERRGITRSFVRQADLRLKIPYQRRFRYSLSAAAAVAVLAFEVMRQRKDARV